MSVGSGFTEQLHTQVENSVLTFLKSEATLYNYFKANGLVRKIEDGQDKIKYFDEKEPDALRMAGSIHNANIIVPQYGETTVGLLYLVGKIQISKQDADKWKSSQFIGGNLIQQTVNAAMRVGVNQAEQFLAWGDEMKNPFDIDNFKGAGEFFGIFNGGTAIGGGAGGDDDVTDANDFLATVHTMKKAMKNAAHDLPQYPIFSDLDTEFNSTVNNNFYSTVGISEYQRVMDLPYIQDWFTSPNFIDNSQVKYRMAMLAPRQRVQGAWGSKGIQKNMELIVGYDWHIHPEHNGGTNNGYFEWLLIHSMRLVEYRATAIQRTGTLTITD